MKFSQAPETEAKEKTCDICTGEGWVCESHPDEKWGDGQYCCGAAGMPCVCNESNPPWHYVRTDLE